MARPRLSNTAGVTATERQIIGPQPDHSTPTGGQAVGGGGGGGGGGTGPLTTLGDTIYENSAPAPDRLPGNTANKRKWMSQTGTGTVSAPPQWNYLPAIYVADFGGVGGGADDTVQYQDAINFAGVVGGARVYCLPSKSRISASLVLPTVNGNVSIMIKGMGTNSTVLAPDANVTLFVGASDSVRPYGYSFEDFWVFYASQSSSGAVFQIPSIHRLLFIRNVQVRLCFDFIQLGADRDNSVFSAVDSVFIKDCYGVFMGGSAFTFQGAIGNLDIAGVTFTGTGGSCQVVNLPSSHTYFQGIDVLTVRHCDFEGYTKGMLWDYVGAGGLSDSFFDFVILDGVSGSHAISITSTHTTPNATACVAGQTYVIKVVGTTNFTLIGAASNTPGLSFIATGPGTGNGTTTQTPITARAKLRNLWVSTTGASHDGLHLDSDFNNSVFGVTDISISGGNFSGVNGIYVGAATETDISAGNKVYGCSGAGIRLASTSGRTQIYGGNRIGPVYGIANVVGVQIDSGAVSWFIEGNDGNGNTTNLVNNGGASNGTTRVITNNIGLNPFVGSVFGRIVLTASQSYNSGSGNEAVVSWSSALEDPAGCWSAGAPTILSVPAGTKHMRVWVPHRWQDNATGSRVIKIKDSTGTPTTIAESGYGAVTMAGIPSGGVPSTAMLDVASLGITAFTVTGTQDSGGALNLLGTAAGTETQLCYEIRE